MARSRTDYDAISKVIVENNGVMAASGMAIKAGCTEWMVRRVAQERGIELIAPKRKKTSIDDPMCGLSTVLLRVSFSSWSSRI